MTLAWRKVWRQKAYKKRSRWRQLTKAQLASKITLFGFIGIIVLTLFSGVLFAWYAKDLPQPDKIVRREGFSTKIYDRNEELLYDVFADQRRTPIKLEEIPLYLRQATVAIEDKNFYKHSGFDPLGIFRGLFNTIIHRRLQGGSTLTQQLVKNVLLTPQRTIARKIKEFILAVQIESRYSKDEILQMYLNENPYGGVTWGVETAAETYFSKKASELNLVESAILAGLPQSPSTYSPFGDNPKAYIGRTKTVLRRMREDDYITKEQEEQAGAQLEDVEFATDSVSFRAPHFVMYVKRQLEERYGTRLVEQGGLKVYTTLDLDVQEAAQEAVTEEIEKVESLHITNGAAIVLDPNTGEILAMVGSKNYNDPDYDGKVNVTLSQRQPGSSIKPVNYVTALKKGYTPSTLIMDTPTTFPVYVPGQPDYKPENYDGQWHGPLQMRYALGNSINLTAVKMLAQVGIKDMLSTAYEMGLTTLEPSKENLQRFGLSLTLGGGEVRLLEMASAYSAFANSGLKVEPISILKVTDQEDKVLDEYKPVSGRRVLTEEQAFLISHMLSDNDARLITFHPRSYLNVSGRTVAVKTGTTNDKRDNWTIGWTPQVIAGVWVGNNDNTPMTQVASGTSGASVIWNRVIQAALKGKPSLGFSMPDGIVTAEVDTISGYRAHDGYPSRTEYFIKGTEPTGDDPVHAKLKLCHGQDKLATAAQVAQGDYREQEYFVFQEEDPVSTDGINRWQEGINAWIATIGDSRYHPPTEYCGSQEEMTVIIDQPSHESEVTSNNVQIEGRVVANNKVTRIEILINGSLEEIIQNNNRFDKIRYLSDGTYTIKVKAEDEKGNKTEREIKIGVNRPWNWEPSPTPTPTLTPPPPTPTPG